MKHVDIKVAGLGLQGARESRRWRKEPLMGSGKVPRIFSQSQFHGVRSHGHPTLCDRIAQRSVATNKKPLGGNSNRLTRYVIQCTISGLDLRTQ